VILVQGNALSIPLADKSTALDEWTNGGGNGKAHSLDDLPMFKGVA